MNQPLLTADEVGFILGYKRNTIYDFVKKGKIDFVRVGRNKKFTQKNVDDFIIKRTVKFIDFPLISPRNEQLSLSEYDKIYLKGDSAVSKKKQYWNYGRKGIFIRRLKSGYSWCFWYYDENGERKKVTAKDAKCKEDAFLEMEKKVREVFNKKFKTTIKFLDFSDIYLEKYAILRKQSWKTDEKFLNAQLIPFFGEMTLNDITPEHVSDFVLKRKKDGVKNSTINKQLQVLRKMMNLADDYGYKIEKNPVRPFHFSNEADNRRTRILSYKEEECLLKVSAIHLKSIIQFALQTGCRLQEILKLKIEDVDFQDETITIRPENNKSGKLDLIPLPYSIEDLLKKLILENLGRSEFVFNYFDPRSNELRPIQSIQHAFRSACRRAGIDNLQFRDLRRTFGTRLHQNGVDPLIIQRLLRHSSFKISEQVYIQSNLAMMKEAMNKTRTETVKKSNNPDHLEHIWNMLRTEKKGTHLNAFISMN